MAQRIRLRRGTTTQWETADTVLAAGEPGVDLTVGEIRIGDGTTPWSELTPVAGGGGGSVPAASTTVAGKVELATSAEAIAGVDTARAVTPSGVAAALAAAAGGGTQLNPATLTYPVNYYSLLPGNVKAGAVTTGFLGASNRWEVGAFVLCESDITITAFQIEVTGAVAATTFRPLICTVDEANQPQSIVWQGSVDCSSTGFKTTTGLSISLAAGTRYALLWRTDGGQATLRIQPANPVAGAGRQADLWDNVTPSGGTSAVSAGAWTEPLPACYSANNFASYATFRCPIMFVWGAA